MIPTELSRTFGLLILIGMPLHLAEARTVHESEGCIYDSASQKGVARACAARLGQNDADQECLGSASVLANSIVITDEDDNDIEYEADYQCVPQPGAVLTCGDKNWGSWATALSIVGDERGNLSVSGKWTADPNAEPPVYSPISFAITDAVVSGPAEHYIGQGFSMTLGHDQTPGSIDHQTGEHLVYFDLKQSGQTSTVGCYR